MNRLLLLFIVLSTGCSAGESENANVFDGKEVREVSLFMSAESSFDIASPACRNGRITPAGSHRY